MRSKQCCPKAASPEDISGTSHSAYFAWCWAAPVCVGTRMERVDCMRTTCMSYESALIRLTHHASPASHMAASGAQQSHPNLALSRFCFTLSNRFVTRLRCDSNRVIIVCDQFWINHPLKTQNAINFLELIINHHPVGNVQLPISEKVNIKNQDLSWWKSLDQTRSIQFCMPSSAAYLAAPQSTPPVITIAAIVQQQGGIWE